MAIPYANRKAWADIPDLALREKPHFTLAEIHGEFATTLKTPLNNVFDCIQVISRNKLCLTFCDKNRMEEIVHTGLVFRGHLLTLTSLHTKKWVSVSRVQYGVPADSVQLALSRFGHITQVKLEVLNGISTGTFSVLMQVDQPIPSKLTIAGRTCYVFYRGQVRTCFKCGQSGHQKGECPQIQQQQERSNALPTTATWGDQNAASTSIVISPAETNAPEIITEPNTNSDLADIESMDDNIESGNQTSESQSSGNPPISSIQPTTTVQMEEDLPNVVLEVLAEGVQSGSQTKETPPNQPQNPPTNMISSESTPQPPSSSDFTECRNRTRDKSTFRDRSPIKFLPATQPQKPSRYRSNRFAPLSTDDETDLSDRQSETDSTTTDDYEKIIDTDGNLIIDETVPSGPRIPNPPFVGSPTPKSNDV